MSVQIHYVTANTFSDTVYKTNDFVTDNHGFGYDQRRAIMELILNETETFRSGFQKMVDSWKLPFPQVLEILSASIKLDPGFKDFVVWARENKVPVIVLSSGMYKIIETLLKLLLGEDLAQDLEIIANDTQLVPPKNSLDEADGWTM
jgi:2-hydroxy-3-keto-5-methylthiopentenyl-1-phosphate phosphatase